MSEFLKRMLNNGGSDGPFDQEQQSWDRYERWVYGLHRRLDIAAAIEKRTPLQELADEALWEDEFLPPRPEL